MASNAPMQPIALTTCTGRVLSATAPADDPSVAVHHAVTQIGRALRRDWGRTSQTPARKFEPGRGGDRRKRWGWGGRASQPPLALKPALPFRLPAGANHA